MPGAREESIFRHFLSTYYTLDHTSNILPTPGALDARDIAGTAAELGIEKEGEVLNPLGASAVRDAEQVRFVFDLNRIASALRFSRIILYISRHGKALSRRNKSLKDEAQVVCVVTLKHTCCSILSLTHWREASACEGNEFKSAYSGSPDISPRATAR